MLRKVNVLSLFIPRFRLKQLFHRGAENPGYFQRQQGRGNEFAQLCGKFHLRMEKVMIS